MIDKYNNNQIEPMAFNDIDNYHDSFSKIKDVQTDLLWEKDNEHSNSVEFSLIIPTYNRVARFREALFSVIHQKGFKKRWEIVVIDNTTVDENSLSPVLLIIQEYVVFPVNFNLRYFHNQKNIGPGYNWNRGVQLARGKWVSFLHDDDILAPWAFRCIEDLVKRDVLYKKPLGYIQARRAFFEDSVSIGKIKSSSRGKCLCLTRRGTRIIGYTETGAPSCGTTILKEAYMSCGGINYDFGPVADAVLGYQIMKNYTVICSDKALGGYRIVGNASSEPESIRLLIYADELFQKARNSASIVGRLWEHIFGSVQKKRNYYLKMRLFEEYSRNKGVLDYLYDVIRISYRVESIMDAYRVEIKRKLLSG